MNLVLYIPAELEKRLNAVDENWKPQAREQALDAIRSLLSENEPMPAGFKTSGEKVVEWVPPASSSV